MQFFERYVRERSRGDHRFFVMASMLKPLVEALATKVHVDDAAEDRSSLRASLAEWSEEQFSARRLRPLASQTLIKIATETDLIGGGARDATTPKGLKEYISGQIDDMAKYNKSSF